MYKENDMYAQRPAWVPCQLQRQEGTPEPEYLGDTAADANLSLDPQYSTDSHWQAPKPQSQGGGGRQAEPTSRFWGHLRFRETQKRREEHALNVGLTGHYWV